MFINISDCHSHSSCSYDGSSTPLAIAQRGKELGLLYQCITDHCECDEYLNYPRDYKSVVSKALKDISALKADFPHLLLGVELGQPMQNLKAADEVLLNKFDFVLGSLHSLANKKDFYFWTELNLEVYQALDKYFEELLEMASWGKFDSLAHLSYPLRYIVGDNAIKVDFERYEKKVDQVYKILIEKQIALEVNTSGLRQKIGETLPNRALVKQYFNAGGRLITLGSDAHSAADVAKGINSGMKMLKEIGFTHYTVYINRKPKMIEIK